MSNNEGHLVDLVTKLKELLLGQPSQPGLPSGEDDSTSQSEQVLHFVRRVEPEGGER